MSFLNRYNKEQEYVYMNSKRIGNEVYSVGYSYNQATNTNYKGLITKTDVEGAVIWEKNYEISGQKFGFLDLIACNNGDILLTCRDFHFIDVQSSYLVRINSDGNLVWGKLFPQVNIFDYPSDPNLIGIGNENYFLVLGDNANGYIIYKIGSNGAVLAQKEITVEDESGTFIFRGITSNSSNIAVYGFISFVTAEINPTEIGIILELDFGLNAINKRLETDSNRVEQLRYHGGNYVTTNTVQNPGNYVFFIKTDVRTLAHITSQIAFLPLPGVNVKYNDNYIYVESYERDRSVITKLNYNFEVLWTKEYQYVERHFAWGILKQVASNNLVILDGSSGYSTSIGLLNLELDTCRTTVLEKLPIIYKGLHLAESTIDYLLLQTAFSIVNVTNISISPLSSSVEEICPPVIEDPCIKDKDLCKLQSDILTIFEDCDFVDPASKNIDYPALADCSSQIFSLVAVFDDNYPAYELVIRLSNQLNAIKLFTGVYNSTTYPDCYEAILFVLDYLSVAGNCDCGNLLELSDTASIQSGNLYLQSAGSVGNDSTEGIHLRWALRDGLSEHLPKGNYAGTSHNFNKADDFVKVYRTPYVPYKVTLDFNNPPLHATETLRQKHWIYEIGSKVFHVHFRNLAKYDQVRATVDPFSDPSSFIQEYGNAVLEIENKTELSFRVSPLFEISAGGATVRTELLSVPENKLTAPKGASLRKTYGAAALNGTPLTAENIRSIRLSGTGAYIVSASFEFYSDFIINTKDAYKWKLLGRYALAKQSNVAFQRLEPQMGCLQNWLRYNDGAFVNAQNYRTKWNSTELPAMERIAVAVERYIALSDAEDNPRALEIFPFENYDDASACSATNDDYDPYIPETPLETNGIELPFLDVLLLGSMDYHVARMLGLGTLDLDPLVLDGAYVYLAEYVTYGDLQDGLGAREVQHLYCSLPTALSDERLPLPIDLKDPVPGAFFNNGYNSADVEQGEEDDEDADHEQNNFAGIELTSDGYTLDGKARYYSLYAEPLADEESNAAFFYTDDEFIACENTDPVFAGLEYRKGTGGSSWIKPELSHSPNFYNLDSSGIPHESKNETVELVVPDQGEAIFTHVVKESGEMEYSSYGINWFSRATASEKVFPVSTKIVPTNHLLPPTNITATLIQKESPLFLTSAHEQELFQENPHFDEDKTLVRLTFEYNHAQELIDYHQKINGETIPSYHEVHDLKEVFADRLQVFFRDRIPNSVTGRIKEITALSNPLLVQVHTEPYPVYSSGINNDIVPPTYNETYEPVLVPGTEDNYKGSILLVAGVEFIVQEVDTTEDYPKFTVLKADASGSLLNLNAAAVPSSEVLVPQQGSLFMLVENMQSQAVWRLPDATGFTINVDLDDVHREDNILIENMDCGNETHVQKFRGVYQNANIEKIMEKVYLDEDTYTGPEDENYVEKHLGLYKVTFPTFKLDQHSQYNLVDQPGEHSVEWFNGIARLHTLENGGRAPRKDFKVVRTQNIGSEEPLVLFIQDPTFPSEDELDTYKGKLMEDHGNQTSQWTNYYPGFKVYLYKDNNLNLNQDKVLPQGEDSIRYTSFAMRSWDFPNEFEFDNDIDFFSKMSVPTLMFANALSEPIRPQLPTGGLYATRPDYFGKASYTFATKYGTPQEKSKPYSVQFNRASDIQFLSAIYDNAAYGNDEHQQPVLNTVQKVMQDVFMNGEEAFYVDRWKDLLSFDYPTGSFATFEGRTLPLPNNKDFIKGINDFVDAHNEYYQLTGDDAAEHLKPDFNLNTEVIKAGTHNSKLDVWNFLKDALLNCFIPLTEIPILYEHVKDGEYKPIPKKQVIRDRNGNLLKPTHRDFDMAPMMKRIDPQGGQYESQFTDFGLDGASSAKYFYAVREINNQLKTSDYSPILGPISLVNTAPPVAPEIVKIIPVLENRTLGVAPAIQLQINAYPTAQKIAKISIYRTNNPAESLSIRTMKLVRVVDLEIENLLGDPKWIFEDDFSDLEELPYGDPLFYRISVSRLIKYNDREGQLIIDYAPSEASKMVLTNMVENYSPESPQVSYVSEPITENGDLHFVNLFWNPTVYKGNYHVYKMTAQGNWTAIARVVADGNDKDRYQVQQLNTEGNWTDVAVVFSLDGVIYLPLEMTNLNSYTLATESTEGTTIYHHFKVLAENTSGMYSTQENILSLYDAGQWNAIGGIGAMSVEGTFIIR